MSVSKAGLRIWGSISKWRYEAADHWYEADYGKREKVEWADQEVLHSVKL